MVTRLFASFLLYRSDEAWIWAAIGAGLGVYLFFRGFQLLSRRRLIANTPTSKIRSASLGLVEVNGLAMGPYTMTAPVTRLPCYYYRTVAWKWKHQDKNSEWVKVADESLHVPFYLDDNTGLLLVDPQGAEMDIHRDFHEEYSDSIFSSKDMVPDNVRSFLMRHGVEADKKIKIAEYCIKPKNALFILGTLAENPGLKVSSTPVPTFSRDSALLQFNLTGGIGMKIMSALRRMQGTTTTVTSKGVTTFTANDGTTPQEVIRLSSDDSKPPYSADMTQQSKIVAALTKAGITNPAAWAAAGVEYSPVPVSVAPTDSGDASVASTAPGFDKNPKVVLMKGANNPAFFISWRSQREVLASLGWKVTLCIWGGPALTLLCAYILAAHFDWL